MEIRVGQVWQEKKYNRRVMQVTELVKHHASRALVTVKLTMIRGTGRPSTMTRPDVLRLGWTFLSDGPAPPRQIKLTLAKDTTATECGPSSDPHPANRASEPADEAARSRRGAAGYHPDDGPSALEVVHRRGGQVMDTAEKRIARAEELDRMAAPGPWTRQNHPAELMASDGYPVAECCRGTYENDAAFIAESRALLPAIAADAKRARHELTIEQALTEDCSRLVIDCLGATGVDLEALAYAPYDATALNAMRRGLPERIRDRVSQRDRAIERAEKAERTADCNALEAVESIIPVLDILRRYQAACARWTESKDPRDEAEVVRLRGQLAIVALPKGGE